MSSGARRDDGMSETRLVAVNGRQFATFAAAVFVYIIDPGTHRFLLMSSPAKRGRPGWEVVGGAVEEGETLAEAVVREVAEEAGPAVRGRRARRHGRVDVAVRRGGLAHDLCGVRRCTPRRRCEPAGCVRARREGSVPVGGAASRPSTRRSGFTQRSGGQGAAAFARGGRGLATAGPWRSPRRTTPPRWRGSARAGRRWSRRGSRATS